MISARTRSQGDLCDRAALLSENQARSRRKIAAARTHFACPREGNLHAQSRRLPAWVLHKFRFHRDGNPVRVFDHHVLFEEQRSAFAAVTRRGRAKMTGASARRCGCRAAYRRSSGEGSAE